MTYLSTAEVAELKGCTPRYIRQLVQSGKLECIEKDNAANNRTEYEIPLAALPEKLQIKYENKKRGELGLEPIPLPSKAVPKPDPRQITPQDLTGDQRGDVELWCEILKEWQAARLSKGKTLGKCKVDELFCATVKLQHPDISISPDILYRKYKSYSSGDIEGLLDHRGGHNKGKSTIPEYMLNAFYSLYLHDNKLPVLKLLASEMGLPFTQSRDDLWMSIAAKLHDGMIIAVDEAQLLTYGSIETLRAFADHFSGRGQTLGVALVGNDGIREKIEGRSREQYRQVNNRAWQRQQLRTIDVRQTDIEMLIPVLSGKKQELSFLHKIAQTAEGVRGAVRLFGNAYDMGEYDFNGLVKMAKMMHLDLKGAEKVVRS